MKSQSPASDTCTPCSVRLKSQVGCLKLNIVATNFVSHYPNPSIVLNWRAKGEGISIAALIALNSYELSRLRTNGSLSRLVGRLLRNRLDQRTTSGFRQLLLRSLPTGVKSSSSSSSSWANLSRTTGHAWSSSPPLPVSIPPQVFPSMHPSPVIHLTMLFHRPNRRRSGRILLAQGLLGFSYKKPRRCCASRSRPPGSQPRPWHRRPGLGMAIIVYLWYGDAPEHRGPAGGIPSEQPGGAVALSRHESGSLLPGGHGGVFLGI